MLCNKPWSIFGSQTKKSIFGSQTKKSIFGSQTKKSIFGSQTKKSIFGSQTNQCLLVIAFHVPSYGKSVINGGFHGKIICKWAMFHSYVK